MSNLDRVLAGLDIMKQRINHVDEMGRRVGIPQELAREVLAIEMACSKRNNEPVDMALVARAILILGEDKQKN